MICNGILYLGSQVVKRVHVDSVWDNRGVLSQAELLDLAEAFAARIPRTADYALDWNAAWRAIASAHLRVDDIGSAQRAMNNVDDACVQAQLRIAAGRWVGRHSASAIGRDILRDTVARASAFEPWWSRRDVTDLVPVVAMVCGVEEVEAMARQLKDPFTAGNVHVTLARALTTPAAQREQLRKAEALATIVRDGDRDFALRWVVEGYRQAGFNEDAERLRRLAAMDPADLTRQERTVLTEAERVLAKADTNLDRHPADTLRDRLRRFMVYGFNDLKVMFLTDASRGGDLEDSEVEAQVRSEAFQRIGPPRAPRLRSNLASLDADGLARLLFARPVCQHDDDKALLEGDDGCEHEHDEAAFVRTLTELLEDFGRLAARFSCEQVEQGLWFVLGEPFWLRDALDDRRIALESRERCVRAMIHPFRDYYLPRDESFSGSVFFMWWDLALLRITDQPSEIDGIAVDVIGQVLQLPAKGCQFAALHGLNHLHPNDAAAQLVRQYLAEHQASLTADEIAWVEACASGEAP